MADEGKDSQRLFAGKMFAIALRTALVSLLAASVGAAFTGSSQMIGALSLAAALMTMLFEAVPLLSRSNAVVVMPDVQANDLARVVQAEWQEEAGARRLRDSILLPLAWDSTSRNVMAPPSAVVGAKVAATAQLKLGGRMAGNFEGAGRDLATSYRRIESGRLVVLGEPGSGKTVLALMLTLGLLADRKDGSPVPVLVSASSWDPIRDDLDTWLINTLAVAYYNGSANIPHLLVQSGLILPVLDGLDEIPEAHRRTAIRSINDAMINSRSMVVTCRSIEYEDLISGGAPRLRRAPVIEVLPLQPEDVVTYLNDLVWPTQLSWGEISDQLRNHPMSPVAQAFSTPLIVSVARTVYQKLGGNPADLLSDDFDSRHSVEDFVTNLAIDAAYAPTANSGRGGSPSSWSESEARRFLTLLAEYLHQHRERDFNWWLVSHRLLSPWVAPALGITFGVLILILIGAWVALIPGSASPSLDATIWAGAGCGGVTAVLVTVVWYATAGRPPGRLYFSRQASWPRLYTGFRTGVLATWIPLGTLLVGVATVITLSSSWRYETIQLFLEVIGVSVAVSAAIGAGFALHSWLDAPPHMAAKAGPLDLIRHDKKSALIGAGAAGVLVAALTLPAIVIGYVCGAVVSKEVSGWMGWPSLHEYIRLADEGRRRSTSDIFAEQSILIGAEILLPALAVALLIFLTRAWPRFLVARVILAASGKLPWRLLQFLQDARDRDLLRQSGGAYQFRHIRLQEHLANRSLNPMKGSEPRLLGSRRVRRRVFILTAMAAAGGCAITLALVPNGNSTLTLAGPPESGPYVAVVSPDGRLLAAGSVRRGLTRIWDLRSGRMRTEILSGANGVTEISFSNDSRLISIGSDKDHDSGSDGYGVWSTYDARNFVEDADYVEFVNGGRGLAASFDSEGMLEDETSTVELWNTITPQRILRLEEVRDWGVGDSQIMTGGPAIPLTLWSTLDGRVLRVVQEKGGYSSATLSADSRNITIRRERSDAVLNSKSGLLLTEAPNLSGFNSIRADRRIIAIIDQDDRNSRSGSVRLLHPGSGRQLLRVHSDAGFSVDGIYVEDPSAGEGWIAIKDNESQTFLVNSSTGRIMANINGYAFASDLNGLTRHVLTETYDEDMGASVVQVWDSLGKQVKFSVPISGRLGPDDRPLGAAVNPGGRTLMTEFEARLTLTDLGSGAKILDLPQRGGAQTRAAFSPDGATLLTDRDGLLELWDTHSGTLSGSLGMQGNLRLTGDVDSIVSQNSNVSPLNTTEKTLNGEARVFSSDGRWLLTSSKRSETLKLWDLRTGRLAKTLTGHSGILDSVGFAADSRSVISVGGNDDTVRLWKVGS